MLGYLQSKDRFDHKIGIGRDETTLLRVPDSELRGCPLLGTFATVDGHLVLLYRWEGDLRLRMGLEPPIILRGLTSIWTHDDLRGTFKLFDRGLKIFEYSYRLTDDFLQSREDPTAFADQEDFDFL